MKKVLSYLYNRDMGYFIGRGIEIGLYFKVTCSGRMFSLVELSSLVDFDLL